ncbi:MAG: acyltransferase [Gammaproteobacteria bacterium]|nr:acyltransferase [Gammaproteobacteria bacterium]
MNVQLSTIAASRDNNFNLLRFCAATGVFISHTFLISKGLKGPAAVLGFISVNIFFIISGYLVTKSLVYRRNMYSFVQARILRIYPALILAVLFSTFVVGTAFTELPIKEYLLHSKTYEYIFKNIFLLIPEIPEMLPGVFVSTPGSSIVNAPLWTLPYELKMYIILGLIGGLLLFKQGQMSKKIFNLVFIVITVVSMSIFVFGYTLRAEPVNFGFKYDYFRFVAMFGSGVLFYIYRDKIYLSSKCFIIIVLLIAVSSMYRPFFVALTYTSLSYLILYCAYIPNGFIRKFNNLGDYSYGIYIYGYPVQQSFEHLWPELNLLTTFLFTYLSTLLLSILSWHLIEKKMLSYKKN